jgi:hypothetical protein
VLLVAKKKWNLKNWNQAPKKIDAELGLSVPGVKKLELGTLKKLTSVTPPSGFIFIGNQHHGLHPWL